MNNYEPNTYSMNLNPEPFKAIKYGKKDIEMRLNDPRRKIIRPGDIIEFVETKTGELLYCRVVALYPFPSFDELYEAFEKERLGYGVNEEAKPEDMMRFIASKTSINGVP